MKKSLILYGVAMAAMVVILKLVEYRYFAGHLSGEIYIGIIAVGFTALGIWFGTKVVGKGRSEEYDTINEAGIRELGLSKRELEVLEWMTKGLSNQEIADKLFVSLSTVKTHTSNLFVKLDVKRRTQAVQKAKELNLVKI